MQQHLYKFLVLHHSLIIPQLGSFIIEEEPARLDAASSLLFAPKPVIHFSETVVHVPDKYFFSFLEEEMDIDEITAVKEFENFCSQMRNTIQEDKIAVLPGIGRVMKGPDDHLFFTPETNLLELLPPIPWQVCTPVSKKAVSELPKQINKETTIEKQEVVVDESVIEETTHQPDRWWVYAIILLVAGSLALLFYRIR